MRNCTYPQRIYLIDRIINRLQINVKYNIIDYMKFVSHSVQDTYDIAKKIATDLKGGEVILLSGDLGAGKTTFTKGLALALGVQDTVTSPTFTFMKSYEGRLTLYHFDMYRAENEDELYELGLADYLDMGGVCVIEWNKFENIKNPIVINIKAIDEHTREIEIL